MSKINIYTTATCVHCTHLKQWLKDHKHQYQEHDVGNDLDKRDFMVKKTGQLSVPVVIITSDDDQQEKIVIGFSPDELQQNLYL